MPDSALLYKKIRTHPGNPGLYRVALTGMALGSLYPDSLLPDGFTDPVLSAFANAILHCSTAPEVSVVFNEAILEAEKLGLRGGFTE
jgi:hypothetical protein